MHILNDKAAPAGEPYVRRKRTEMEKQTPTEVILGDPLRELTRKERTRLLIVSVLGIIVVHTKLVPSRIDVLGIEFAQTQQEKILVVLAVLVAYYLVAFLLYAAVDFTSWRLAYLDSHEFPKFPVLDPKAEGQTGRTLNEDELRDLKWWMDLHKSHRVYMSLQWPLSKARAIFDFLLPVVVSLYAITALLCATL